MSQLISIRIANYSTGFSDIPGQISLNIYAQGCKNNCEGCHNPELQNFDGGFSINLADMGYILGQHLLPTWICWLGGDITYQEDGFLHFNRFLKDEGFGICLYTGRYFEDITNLLDNVDLVIDGPWKGKPITDITTNQRIFHKKDGKWSRISSFLTLEDILKENHANKTSI